MTKKLGKRGVLVKDAPAFVVNRLLTRQSTVLMQALENGNTFEETDEAALRLGLPMPPSALLAMVGPRVANHVLHTLHDAFPDRFPLSPTLENFANGEMDIVLTGDDRRSEDEIYQRILEALADEARHLLDEGVVASAGEIDACLILGAGFPFFRGGLTQYLDPEGVSTRVSGRPLGERLKTSIVRPLPVQFVHTAPLARPKRVSVLILKESSTRVVCCAYARDRPQPDTSVVGACRGLGSLRAPRSCLVRRAVPPRR